MQWYLLDKERLEIEVVLMERNGVNFQLCYDECDNLLWRGPLRVLRRYHNDVRLVYPEIFPYGQIKIYVLDPKLPEVNLHVHEDGGVCVMKDEEWSSDWTAYAMYLKTIEFLTAFYSGEMNDSSPLGRTHQPGRGFLDSFMELLGP